MKVAAITNGISANYETACRIMRETGLQYAELQHLEGKQIPELAIGEVRSVPGVPVETLCEEEAYRVKALSEEYGITPVVITSHAFCGIPVKTTEIGDKTYEAHYALLKNAIRFAHILGVRLIRVMCFSKQPVMFGYHGAREWLANDNTTWEKFISLYPPVLELAEKEDVELILENGNGMVCSAALMRRMADDLQSDRLKFLWDPANGLYYNEKPTVEVYRYIRDILAHVHIKDLVVDIPTAMMDVKKIGQGELAPYLPALAEAMKEDGYEGCVSLENIYKPDGGTFLDGYYQDIVTLKELFE